MAAKLKPMNFTHVWSAHRDSAHYVANLLLVTLVAFFFGDAIKQSNRDFDDKKMSAVVALVSTGKGLPLERINLR